MKVLFLDESGDHNLSVIDPKPDKEDWRIVEAKFRRSRRGKIAGHASNLIRTMPTNSAC